jgi:hypothetical protein
MYQVVPGVTAGTAVLGTQIAAGQPAQTALATTGLAIGIYLMAAVCFLVAGFVLRHYGSTRSAA